MLRKQPWLAALLYGVTLLAFWPSLHGDFIWNDSDYVTAPALRSWGGLGRIWFDVGAVQQYYPALHTAFWIEHRLWGDSVLGYHLVNVLLHATAALLFVFVLGRFFKPSVAWIGGFLFALHPICAESVSWISEQKNTLSTALYLASALLFLRFHDEGAESGRGGSRLYLFSTVLYALALLSKSFAATLPAALLVVLWWRKGRLEWRKDVRPLLPWFAIGIAGGLFTAWVEYRYIGARGGVFRLSLIQRFLVSGRIVWFYLGKLAWPHPLIFIYPRWTIRPSEAWQYAYPLALIGLLWASWALRRRNRGPLAALLLFVGSLFPVLGFFNVYAFNFSYVADHFLYLPALGLIALAAAGWGSLAGRFRRTAVLAGVAVPVLFGSITWRECHQYRDLPTFYRSILAKNPNAWMAHNNLGAWLNDHGRPLEAKAEYEAALRLRPDYAEALDNVGLMLAAEDRLPEAIGYYRKALAIEPLLPDAHRNYANALFREGRTNEAFVEYEAAIRGRHDDAHAWNDLGYALFSLNRLDEAAEQFRTSLRYDPSFPDAHSNLGNVLTRMGRSDEGLAEYARAVELDPANGTSRSNYGLALAQAGRIPEALEQLEAAVRASPQLEGAHNNLGNVLLAMGRTDEAKTEFETALRLNPRSVQACNNLGNVLVRKGRLDEAIARYQAALDLDPNYLESRINLGVVLCRLGRIEDGIHSFEEALRLAPDSAQARQYLDRARAMLQARANRSP